LLKRISIFAIVWAICGIFNYGATLGFFEGKYLSHTEAERIKHQRAALSVAALGPVGIIPAVLGSNFLKYGLKFSSEIKERTLLH